MHYAFEFLPLELQTSIKELITLGNLPDSAVDLLIERAAHAIEAKTISAQRQVVDIEQSLERRVGLIGDKLAGDLRSQLGATNGMLIDIRTLVQSQEAAVAGLRAEFQAFGEDVSGRITVLETRQNDLEKKTDAQYKESQNDRADLRTQGQETQTQLKAVAARLDTFIARIDNLIAQSIPPEKAQQYREFLDELMQAQSGGGNG